MLRSLIQFVFIIVVGHIHALAQYPPRPQFQTFTPIDPARSPDWQPNPLYRSPLQPWHSSGPKLGIPPPQPMTLPAPPPRGGHPHDQLPADLRQQLEAERHERALAQLRAAYEEAAAEITAMMEGRKPLDLKRAVFLSENPFYFNRLNYTGFSREILAVADECRAWADARPQTPRPQALLEGLMAYMRDTARVQAEGREWLRPPMSYDFNDFRGDRDRKNYFVTKLMLTRKGQCHSMPLFFLLVARELDLPAWLAYAPDHSFIRLKDHTGRWLNLELTHVSFVSNQFLLSSGLVKRDALLSKTYLDTVSHRETAANCLIDLAGSYEWQLGPTDFTERCADRVLSQFPQNLYAHMLKANAERARFLKAAERKGWPKPEELDKHPDLLTLRQRFIKRRDHIQAMGYESMTDEQYTSWLGSAAPK